MLHLLLVQAAQLVEGGQAGAVRQVEQAQQRRGLAPEAGPQAPALQRIARVPQLRRKEDEEILSSAG